MALAVALEDVIANREKRDAPGKTGSSTLFFVSREDPDFPHARYAEQDPGRYTAPHFHIRDQFQIVVRGRGKFGRHAIAPYGVHFTRAYTPYGPLVADANEGMAFIVLRNTFDPGSHDLPEATALLKQIPDRRPWQITRQAVFPESQAAVALHEIPDLRNEDGLAGYTLRMRPDHSAQLPDPAQSGGQYIVVIKGSALHANGEYKAPAVVYVWPKEAPYSIRSGAAGLDALVLHFPRKP